MGKKIVIAALALALTATAATASLGSIVGSFRAPGTAVRGLARSDTRLHVVIFGNPTRIYRVAPLTGSIAGSWVPAFGNNCRGLAYSDGGHLWVGDYGHDRVYDCAATTGSVYGSWDVNHDPYGLAPYCTGDGGVGTTAIFSSDWVPSYCWRLSKGSGTVLGSFELDPSSYFDIAWDHRNQLVWVAGPNDVAYGYSTAGSVKASFAAPASYPYGMAYYGEYLWIGCAGNGYIYRVSCPGTLSIAPASLGKVRALFR